MKSKQLKPYHSNRNISPKIREGKTLLVDEIFLSIQTEGPFSGMPALFIRLWGCNLNCSFCDTPQDNKPEKHSVKKLLKRIKKHSLTPMVIITGGEPLLYNLSPLITALTEHPEEGFIVQIETSGSVAAKALDLTSPRLHVVVSPKTKKIDPDLAKNATVFKYVISHKNMDHTTGLPKGVFIPNGEKGKIMVSPMFTDDPKETQENAQLAATVCKSFGYWMTLQWHKFIGIQ